MSAWRASVDVGAAGHRHQRHAEALERRQDRRELVALAAVGDRQHDVAGRDHAEVAVAGLGRDGRRTPACRSRPASPRSCGRRGRSCPCPSRRRGRGTRSIARTARAKPRPGARLQRRAAPRASMSKVSRARRKRAVRRRRRSGRHVESVRPSRIGAILGARAGVAWPRPCVARVRWPRTLELTLLYLRRRRARRGGLPLAQAAADAGLSGGRRADRPERAGAGQGHGRRQAPGRIRRRVPDVRDRARVQPAQAAQHAHAGVRPRPVARWC